MQRNLTIYLILSILVVLLAKYVHQAVIYIDMAYYWINAQLMPIFSKTGTGDMIRQTLVLSIVPLLLAGIPTLAYQMVSGKKLSWFLELTWVLWLTIALSVLVIR